MNKKGEGGACSQNSRSCNLEWKQQSKTLIASHRWRIAGLKRATYSHLSVELICLHHSFIVLLKCRANSTQYKNIEHAALFRWIRDCAGSNSSRITRGKGGGGIYFRPSTLTNIPGLYAHERRGRGMCGDFLCVVCYRLASMAVCRAVSKHSVRTLCSLMDDIVCKYCLNVTTLLP